MNILKLPFAFIALVLLSWQTTAGTLGVFTAEPAGFDTHTFYYDDGKEVTIIDTQFVPALTEAMVKKIRSETSSPITRVIVTHPNPDKFNGLAYLHDLGVKSVSSQDVAEAMPKVHEYKKNFWVNTMKSFTEDAYPKFENVQSTFDKQMTIKLKSGETLSLFQLENAGVATTQVVVRIDQTGDLIVGDLVHHKAHAWLEGGLVQGSPAPDINAWLAALAELPALTKDYPNAKVFGGRGEFVKVEEAVDYQRHYLRKAKTIVDAYISNNDAKISEFDSAAKAQEHYKQLATIFSTKFPEYQLPYMIQYSVYGLVASRKGHYLKSTTRIN